MTTELNTGRLSRRHLLTGGAGVVGGAAVGALGASWATGTAAAPERPATDAVGRRTEEFHGAHQAGIATPPQLAATFVSFTLREGVDREALGRWMGLWTDDARRLTAGEPALADTEPELAAAPSRLTVTVGFGPGVPAAAGRADQRPDWLAPLPSFGIDRLQDRWNGGDVLLHVGCDDPTTLAHALRVLMKDARSFAVSRWHQRGFLHTPGTRAEGATPRNLMGQLDGTSNPRPGTAAFDAAVWITDGPEWTRGGTGLVLRRIRIEMDTWDELDRPAREQTIGRTLDTGAPLTGTAELDVPDFEAVNAHGFTVIPDFAHVRRAHVADPAEMMFRRSYNYDVDTDGQGEAGLIFAAYQADIERQFIPVQRRLDELDLLNEWTTPIGSAVFAMLPGVSHDGWLGQGLLG